MSGDLRVEVPRSDSMWIGGSSPTRPVSHAVAHPMPGGGPILSQPPPSRLSQEQRRTAALGGPCSVATDLLVGDARTGQSVRLYAT